MQLYLVQHGESASERDDPARPLTERGRREVERVARTAAKLRLALDLVTIFHSGKLRAQQTAEILAEHLQPARGAVEMPGLAPMDDPGLVRPAVEEAGGPQMLVGHLPHLSRLASLLLVGDSACEVIAFRMGAIVCLGQNVERGVSGRAGADGGAAGRRPSSSEGGEAGAWRLHWILTPELAYT